MMLTAGIEADDGKSSLGRPCTEEFDASGCAGAITPELSVGSLAGGGTDAAPIVAEGPAARDGACGFDSGAIGGCWFMAIGGC